MSENDAIYNEILSNLEFKLTQTDGLQHIRAQLKENKIRNSYALIEFLYKQIKDPFDHNPRSTVAFMNWLRIYRQKDKHEKIIKFINDNALLNYEGGGRRMHRKLSHTRRHKKARKHTRRHKKRHGRN